jgi:hypothetical protein
MAKKVKKQKKAKSPANEPGRSAMDTIGSMPGGGWETIR